MTYKFSCGTPVTLDHKRVRGVVSECADYVTVKWLDVCGRCGGTGIYCHYSHYNGVCYGCGGTGNKGVTKRRLYTEAGYAKVEALKVKAAEKKAAKLAAKKAAAVEVNRAKVGAEVWDAIAAWNDEGGEHSGKNNLTILDIFSRGLNWELSDKAAEHLARCWANKLKWDAERAAKDAEAEDVTEGRYTVVGKVISVKGCSTDFGWVYKMLVDCGTFRAYGSVPKGLDINTLAGSEIKFTATFKAKEKGFGFFSRPTKPELLEAAAAA